VIEGVREVRSVVGDAEERLGVRADFILFGRVYAIVGLFLEMTGLTAEAAQLAFTTLPKRDHHDKNKQLTKTRQGTTLTRVKAQKQHRPKEHASITALMNERIEQKRHNNEATLTIKHHNRHTKTTRSTQKHRTHHRQTPNALQ
jgi:hypothetical protein